MLEMVLRADLLLLRTSPLYYHTMSTTQLENLLNTTLGQIRFIAYSLQTGVTTLDNYTFILEQLHGIIYNIYITHYTNSPRSVIIEDICTLVTLDLCETFDITSEYTQHIISQTTRDILDATLKKPQVNMILTSTTTNTRNKTSTSRSPHLSKRKPPTRNARPVKNPLKKTTSTTSYPTISMQEKRRTLINILNKITYIVLIAQHTTNGKANKALEKLLVRIYRIMVGINPEVTHSDTINEISGFTALHTSTDIPHFSSDYALCALRETFHAILISATSPSTSNTQRPPNITSPHTRSTLEPITTTQHASSSTTNNQPITNDNFSMKPLSTSACLPPPPGTSRLPTGTTREIYIKPFLPITNTTTPSSTSCCLSSTSAITPPPPTTLTNPITTELLTTVALSTTTNTDTPSQILHPEPLVTTSCSHSQQTATQPEPSVPINRGMRPMKSPCKRPPSFYTSTTSLSEPPPSDTNLFHNTLTSTTTTPNTTNCSIYDLTPHANQLIITTTLEKIRDISRAIHMRTTTYNTSYFFIQCHIFTLYHHQDLINFQLGKHTTYMATIDEVVLMVTDMLRAEPSPPKTKYPLLSSQNHIRTSLISYVESNNRTSRDTTTTTTTTAPKKLVHHPPPSPSPSDPPISWVRMFLYGLVYSLIILLHYHLPTESTNTSQNYIYTTHKLNTNIWTNNLHLNNNRHLNNNLHLNDNLHSKNISNPIMNNFHLSQHYHQHSPATKTVHEARMDLLDKLTRHTNNILDLDTISRTHHNNPPEDILTTDTCTGRYNHSAPTPWTAHHYIIAPAPHTEEVPSQHLILLKHQDLTTMKTPTITENPRRNFREARRIYEPP